MSASLENSAVAQDWKKLVFIPIPKKGNVKECSDNHTIALISHSSKVMFRILQARFQDGFRKGKGIRDQITNIAIEEAGEFQKIIYFCFINYAKAFVCVDHNKLCKILKEMGIPDHLICPLRNLYAGQEAIIIIAQGTTEWFQISKGEYQGCIYCHPAYLSNMQSLL